ncbi:MAG: hypothetical protein ACREIA_20560 [Opitutaceae bacterium]
MPLIGGLEELGAALASEVSPAAGGRCAIGKPAGKDAREPVSCASNAEKARKCAIERHGYIVLKEEAKQIASAFSTSPALPAFEHEILK